MSLDELARRFENAHPALTLSRSLQRRVDRKFLLAERHLESLLPRLQASYSVLRAGDRPWARYDSIYFDTPERLLFHAHRRGRLPRFKVRIRRHLDRNLAFLEIKRKDATRRTIKHRLPVQTTQSEFFGQEMEFIAEHIPGVAAVSLTPVLSVSFLRLTLVANEALERLTLDRELNFDGNGRNEFMRGLVVGETKQERCMNDSGSVAAFRHVRAREASFSKYCIGTALLGGVSANVFKPSFRAAARQIA